MTRLTLDFWEHVLRSAKTAVRQSGLVTESWNPQVNYMGFRSRIIVWDFETGDAVAKYDAHKVRVESIAFSSCETYALSLGGLDDGAVMVYDIGRQQVGGSSVNTTRRGIRR